LAPSVDDLEPIFRAEYGRCVTTLITAFGDIDLVEDAVQDAFTIALRTWAQDGVPRKPRAWITTTARRRAIDRLRRDARGRELQRHATASDDDTATEEVGPVHDDRLRLIFTCCHPALATDTQVALTLRLLGGLRTEEVARAFLVPIETMAKRLVRAKHKIRAAQIPYRIPTDAKLPDRLPGVLAVVYLIYSTGADGPAGDDLCAEAIRLARTLADLMPDESEVAGLLALLLLTESRRQARRHDGRLVLLADQDRATWDAALIAEGTAIVLGCVRRDHPGPYQIQAAINAVHADAASIETTDWAQVMALYDHLYQLTPTPVVALNRAIAIGEVDGPAAALALTDDLRLDGYWPYHATRADLLHRLGRDSEAADGYTRAAAMAPGEAEREYLAGRLGGLS